MENKEKEEIHKSYLTPASILELGVYTLGYTPIQILNFIGNEALPQVIRHHGGSFFGMAAFTKATEFYIKDFSESNSLTLKNSTVRGISSFINSTALTTYELLQSTAENRSFDWKDMTAYAGALLLYNVSGKLQDEHNDWKNSGLKPKITFPRHILNKIRGKPSCNITQTNDLDSKNENLGR